MIRALISQSRGLAVFDDGSGLQIWDGISHAPSQQDERHTARILHGTCDLEALEVEDRIALARHLELRRDREDLLHATLILIDGTRSNELRATAAQVWKRTWAEELWLWVASVLLSTPAPATADFVGAAHHVGERGGLLQEIAELQPAVNAVARAWQAIPNERFKGYLREDARAAAVRAGHFGAMVRRIGSHSPHDADEVLKWWCDMLVTPSESLEGAPRPRDIPAVWTDWLMRKRELATSLQRTEHVSWLTKLFDEIKPSDPVTSIQGTPTHFELPQWSIEHTRVLALALHSASPHWTATGSPEECRAFHFSSAEARAESLLHAGADEPRFFLQFLRDAREQMTTGDEWRVCNRSPSYDFFFVWITHRSEGQLSILRHWSATETQKARTRLRRLLDLRETARLSARIFLSACTSGALERGGCWAERTTTIGFHSRMVFLNPLDDLRCEFDELSSALVEVLSQRLTADHRSALPPQRAGWMSLDDAAKCVGDVKLAIAATFGEARERARQKGFHPNLFDQQEDRIRLDPEYFLAELLDATVRRG